MSDSLCLTIEYASSTKKELMSLLESKDPVSLDLSVTKDLDLSGLQILVALVREANVLKKSVHFTGLLSEGVNRALRLSGIAESDCRTGEQLEAAIKAVC